MYTMYLRTHMQSTRIHQRELMDMAEHRTTLLCKDECWFQAKRTYPVLNNDEVLHTRRGCHAFLGVHLQGRTIRIKLFLQLSTSALKISHV